MEFIIDNVYTTINFTENKRFINYFEKELHKIIDPLDPDRYRKTAFRRHYWDGRIVFYDKKKKRFLTGLLDTVLDGIKSLQTQTEIHYTLKDIRQSALKPLIMPEEFTLHNGDSEIVMQHDDPKWGYQYDAVKYALENQRAIINVSTNGGKAIENSVFLPMADGTEKQVKDIKPGDFLIGADGKATKVLRVFPQPLSMYFKITLSDRRSFVVSDEHLIPYYDYFGSSKDLKVDNVETLLRRGYFRETYYRSEDEGKPKLTKQVVYRYAIPLTKPVSCYPVKIYQEYPYGAGRALRLRSRTSSNFDLQELTEKWLINAANERGWFLFGFIYGADCKTAAEFVDYLSESRKLKGQSINPVVFTVENSAIAHWIRKLIDSLGHYCVMTLEKDGSKDCYKFTLDFSDKADCSEIIDISFEGLKNGTCFQVDNESHMFLINDYIVTHNTEISAAVVKEDLKLLDNDDCVLFLCGSKDIAYQTQKRYAERLDRPIGFWGDGKKDIKQITCATIRTLANALKKNPNDNAVVQLKSPKDKALKFLALELVPVFIKYPNTRQVIKTFLNNNKPKYAYLEPTFMQLAQLAASDLSNDEIRDALKYYQESYRKLIISKNKKVYQQYTEILDFLASVKVLIGDEFHHFASADYQLVVNHMPNARQRIGLTGTLDKKSPERYQKLIGITGNNIFKISNDYLIKREISAKPFIKLVPITQPDLTKDEKGILLSPNPLQQYQYYYDIGVIHNNYRNKVIAKLVQGLASTGAVTLIVVNSIEHGETIQASLEEEGVPTGFLQGSLESDDRKELLADVRKGKVLALIGTSVVDEGIDLPNIKYLVYASAGKSYRAVLQRVGRILRISKDKNQTMIFDLIDRTTPMLYKQAKKRIKYYKNEQFKILKS